MTVQMINNQHRQVAVDIITPVAQASVNAETLLAGSEIDMRMWRSLAYTLKVATNDVTWVVYGANSADYSDEVVVQSAANVVAGAAGTYAVAQAPYAYYRVKIYSTVGGSHGTGTLIGIAKG
ncbi:MAG: hypothetical protein WA118_08835 [Carboxydocellales bacterium]